MSEPKKNKKVTENPSFKEVKTKGEQAAPPAEKKNSPPAVTAAPPAEKKKTPPAEPGLNSKKPPSNGKGVDFEKQKANFEEKYNVNTLYLPSIKKYQILTLKGGRCLYKPITKDELIKVIDKLEKGNARKITNCRKPHLF